MALVADMALNHHSLTHSSFHRLDMTLAVAEVLNPNKPNHPLTAEDLNVPSLNHHSPSKEFTVFETA